MNPTYTVNAVLFERDPGEWVAQCLEYDIGAQAGSLPDLLYELQRSIVGHIVIALENKLQPLECLSPAPEEYWDMWSQAKITVQAEELPFRTPEQGPTIVPRLKIAA